eukprot:3146818-Amphidinium_carterae.1
MRFAIVSVIIGFIANFFSQSPLCSLSRKVGGEAMERLTKLMLQTSPALCYRFSRVGSPLVLRNRLSHSGGPTLDPIGPLLTPIPGN